MIRVQIGRAATSDMSIDDYCMFLAKARDGGALAKNEQYVITGEDGYVPLATREMVRVRR